MSNNKPLSRNKTIKILHSITGRSFKECRADLKANNWDLNNALGLNRLSDFTSGLYEATQHIIKAFNALSTAAARATEVFINTLSEGLSND